MWQTKKLGDICSNISTNNKRIKQKNYEQNAELPVIDQGEDLIGGYTNEVSSKVKCDLPAIIFGDHTKAVKFVNFDFAPGADGIKVLEPKKNINPKFLYYLLKRMVFEIPDKGYARHFQYLNKEKYPVPPLPTQNRIVEKIEELFSELDNGMENLKKAQKQLKTYRQAVLKDAFEGKLTKEWREQQDDLPTPKELLRQIKAERKAHRQRELAEWEKEVEQWEKDGNPGRKPRKPRAPKSVSEINEDDLKEFKLPDRWVLQRIGKVSNVVRGGSPRPAGDPKYYDGTIPFLKVADLTNDESPYLSDYENTIKEAGLNKTRLVKPKTLLLSNSGATLGVPKITNISATFNDGIAAFLELKEHTLLYHYYFWRSKTKYLRAINQGAAQPNLNTTIIAETLIPICSDDEMVEVVNEIESRLSVVDQLEQTIKENLQKAEALRQSILKKAFGGELV